VIGKVGSGKTTLLNSVMGETILKNGEITVKGKLAYVE
jgi:ABC-type branched-subunit amino acid transport system ATPase component